MQKDAVKRAEFIRVINQALRDLGLNETAAFLEKESGITLESPEIALLCKGINDGNWNEVEVHINKLNLSKSQFAEVKFLIYEQKFLELIEAEKVTEALECLRKQLTPLNKNHNRLHFLSSLLMCSSGEEVRSKAQWDGASGSSRIKLLEMLKEYIPPEKLLTTGRLETLVMQALELQQRDCLYHNVFNSEISILKDHHCSSGVLPSECRFILDSHTDEVWCVKFSHNGKYLASSSKDSTVILWSISDTETKPTVIRVLRGHTNPVGILAFSKNDNLLLTGSNDRLIKLWEVETGKCLKTFAKHHESVTSLAWLSDNIHFVSAADSTKENVIYLMNIDGNEIYSWSGIRANDLAVTSDDKTLITICQERKIKLFNLEDKSCICTLNENVPLVSMDLSNDNKYLIITIAREEVQELKLFNLEDRKWEQRYKGSTQLRFYLRPCFGGVNQAFIACGGEDSEVYIWHRARGLVLKKLDGHSGPVNAVAWSPTNPALLASGSDDHTIRIWSATYIP